MLVKPQTNPVAKIKVVGVGGAGGNVINTMVDDKGIYDVEFISINTDSQALQNSKADIKLRIGDGITRGLGSGGNPLIGKKAAEETIEQIHENLAGADMVFIAAGMGGGTGTGASPIVGEVGKNLGALTIAVVMKPFHFEAQRRMETALKGIEELKQKVDTMIVIPNQRLLEIMDPGASFLDAMHKSDEVMLQAVKSIANLSTQTGLINVDFADVRAIMDNAGTALMGIGRAKGESRAVEAATMAIESPLLEVKIDGATGVLFNVVGGRNMGIREIDEAAKVIGERISGDANVIFGARIAEEMEGIADDEIEITVIATGFSDEDSRIITSVVDPFKLRAARTIGGNKEPAEQQQQATPVVDQGQQRPRSNVFGMFAQEEEQPQQPQQAAGNAWDQDDDYEDTPSFLRRRTS